VSAVVTFGYERHLFELCADSEGAELLGRILHVVFVRTVHGFDVFPGVCFVLDRILDLSVVFVGLGEPLGILQLGPGGLPLHNC